MCVLKAEAELAVVWVPNHRSEPVYKQDFRVCPWTTREDLAASPWLRYLVRFFTLLRSIYLFKIASTRFRFSRESLPRKRATVTIVGIPFLLFRLPFVHPLVTCTWNDRKSRWVTQWLQKVIAHRSICHGNDISSFVSFGGTYVYTTRKICNRRNETYRPWRNGTELEIEGMWKLVYLATGMLGISRFEWKRSNVQPIYLTNASCVLYETVHGKRNCKK